jgi:uncharacterized protein
MIVELVRAGQKVGVTANSHKVVANLLQAVAGAARDSNLEVRLARKPKDSDEPEEHSIRHICDASQALSALATEEVHVLGGTAWLWSLSGAAAAVDVLVVDEAGQMSLAHVMAVSQAARSVVLLGDPQQLEQPQKASHPDGVGVAALQHVLGAHQTVPRDRGVFLPETWRLAPAICRFTSECFYEGRLSSKPGLEMQRLDGPTPWVGAGLRVVSVDHDGCRNASDEEVDAVERIVTELVAPGVTFTGEDGARPLTAADVLVVAPYNAHVSRLSARLDARGVRVGTVDRFQGQEAPVVIYAMATSRPDDAPRGMEFLYSRNRLNVATSRAKALAIVVASPRLFEPDCRTPRQMRLANALCRFRELAI